jgi:hypothetical protein
MRDAPSPSHTRIDISLCKVPIVNTASIDSVGSSFFFVRTFNQCNTVSYVSTFAVFIYSHGLYNSSFHLTDNYIIEAYSKNHILTDRIMVSFAIAAFVLLSLASTSLGNECPKIVTQKDFDVNKVNILSIQFTSSPTY